MTNQQFADTNPTLRKACELADIPVTKRQASKWQRQRGKAYVQRLRALSELARERAGR